MMVQKIISSLKSDIREHVIPCLDDILIFSKDEQEHIVILEHVHPAFDQNGIMLKPDKSSLFCDNIDYLGFCGFHSTLLLKFTKKNQDSNSNFLPKECSKDVQCSIKTKIAQPLPRFWQGVYYNPCPLCTRV